MPFEWARRRAATSSSESSGRCFTHWYAVDFATPNCWAMSLTEQP
ncbi:hypothetical protein [Micromonospora sp. NPDC050200]